MLNEGLHHSAFARSVFWRRDLIQCIYFMCGVNPFSTRPWLGSKTVPPARTVPRTSGPASAAPRRRHRVTSSRRHRCRTCSVCRRRAWSPCSAPWPASRTSYPTPSRIPPGNRWPSWSGWSTGRTPRPCSPTGTNGGNCASPRPARSSTRTRSPPDKCLCGEKTAVVITSHRRMILHATTCQWHVGCPKVFKTEILDKRSGHTSTYRLSRGFREFGSPILYIRFLTGLKTTGFIQPITPPSISYELSRNYEF